MRVKTPVLVANGNVFHAAFLNGEKFEQCYEKCAKWGIIAPSINNVMIYCRKTFLNSKGGRFFLLKRGASFMKSFLFMSAHHTGVIASIASV